MCNRFSIHDIDEICRHYGVENVADYGLPLDVLPRSMTPSLVYGESGAPELIRENSEDDLVDAANEINRQDGEITSERLRQAVDHLHAAAKVLPHLHSAWFVTRQRRTVWIPNNVDEHFTNATVDEPRPSDAPDDWKPTKQVKATQEVDAEDRKRIAIEEGQKARYALASFETRWAAWFSGGLYILAGWFLLVIVLRQLGHIAAASSASWLAWVPQFLTQDWITHSVAWMVVIGTMLGMILVFEEEEQETRWSERFFEWLASKWPAKKKPNPDKQTGSPTG